MKELLSILTTFILVVFAWVFFRAVSIEHAFRCFSAIFSASFFSIPYFQGIGLKLPFIIYLILFILIEWIGRNYQYGIQMIKHLEFQGLRWASYACIILVTYYYSVGTDGAQFIYFQF